MKVSYVEFQQIKYTKTPYDSMLYESVKRIGCSFPLHVLLDEHGYHCIDGHKRLSVLNDLYESGVIQLMNVAILIKNNGDARSDGGWSLRNHH